MAATRGTVGSAGSGRSALAHSARTLPGCPALERGQVDHRDRQVDRPRLGGGLDRPGATVSPTRASAPTWSTPGQAVQEPAQGRIR